MAYSPQITRIICELIVAGHSLRAIGAVRGLPAKATIMRWLRDTRKITFLDAYRRAKFVQSIVVGEELHYLIERGADHRSLGQHGGRPCKLWLKSNREPNGCGLFSAAKKEVERRARLMYAVALSPNT